MNIEQFNESMKRVLAFTQAPKNQSEAQHLQNYMNGLYEAVGDMDGFLFERVTVELCKNMSRGQRPMPGQFRAIYYRLKDEQRAKSPERICPSCKNTVWVMSVMMETATGKEAIFAEPCPECQSRHPLKDAPPRLGWIKVEKPFTPHDQQMLIQAKAMGPKGARFVLDLVEKMNTNFHPDVILALLERADSQPQENKAAEAVLSSLTREPQRETTAQAVAGSGAPEVYEIEE